MKQDLTDFSIKEKVLVKKLYEEGYNVKEISELTNLSYYETIFLLRKLIDDFTYDDKIACASINDRDVLILSDTHIGSVYENLDYLKDTYRFAKKNDIHAVIHGGDLIQSTFKNVQDQLQDEKKQLEYVVKVYPYSSDIKNYILLGNHDYNTLKKGDYYFDILKERDDFEFLGFKRAYLLWNNQLVSICHTTKKYHLPILSVENVLNLKGHSHKLSYNKQKSIDIPTLSDDLLLRKKAQPGFLIGDMSQKSLEIDSYIFKNNITNEGPILKKKI